MYTYPKVLSIAGSDCSGGAGIQADLKTFSALGVYGMSVITSITAQNTCGVTGVQGVNPDMVAKQLDAVFTDIYPDAVKIGMLYSQEIIEVVAERLRYHKAKHIILDPVMISTSGCKLIEDNAIKSLENSLMPIAELITPNMLETECLCGFKIHNNEDAYKAANVIQGKGATSVLIKGGDVDSDEANDILIMADGNTHFYNAARIHSKNTHGTGCTLSSAIASYMSLGYTLADAISEAKKYVFNAIKNGADVVIGRGQGPLCHQFAPLPINKFNQLIMKVFFNSKEIFVGEKASLYELLNAENALADGIAVAVNNIVIPRDEWSSKFLSENDKIIVIKATYGG